MSPFIRDGDVVTVAPFADGAPRVGDVVAVGLLDMARLAIHRVVAHAPEGWMTRGDNLRDADGVFGPSQILGTTVRVERNGRHVRLGVTASGRLVARLSQRGSLYRARSVLRTPRRVAWFLLSHAQALGLYRAVGRGIGLEADLTEATRSDVEALFSRLPLDNAGCDRADDGHITDWVAKRNGKPLGFVQLVRRARPDSSSRSYWLFSLMVRGRYRGLGIGEMLTRQVIEQAKAEGAPELRLAVFDDNLSAILLYRKLGFEPTVGEELRVMYRAEGSGRGHIAMRKPLASGT